MARYTTRSSGAFDCSFKEPIINPFEIKFTLPNADFVKIIHLAKD